MTYDIAIYHRATQEREQAYSGEDFFDDASYLVPLTSDQKNLLMDELLESGYVFESVMLEHYQFVHPDYGLALVTPDALYLTLSFDDDAIFEVGMLASELVMDNPDLAKYDPQAGGWEVFEEE